MPGYIQKIKLYNFKKFEKLELSFNQDLNILIGDNESGKSTILQAIDLVLSGSRSKVESLGLEHLVNSTAIESFFSLPTKEVLQLPKLRIELFLSEQNNIRTNGKVYLGAAESCDGVSLVCEPNVDYHEDILRIIKNPDNRIIPFELYTISFSTFAGQAYSGYTKPYKCLLLDSTSVNAELATKQYVHEIYSANVDTLERSLNQGKYRAMKQVYAQKVLNNHILGDGYSFSLKNSIKNNLDTDLTLTKGRVDIDNQGRGLQCFVKATLALSNSKGAGSILIEEPENHLSHTRMRELIASIKQASGCQLFISTHNNLICSGLDLRKVIFMNPSYALYGSLSQVSEDTSAFFQKAPDNNLLQFILSQKVVLVEGAAEFILMGAFYFSITGRTMEADGVHLISVGGLKFKRYLEIAQLLGIKTAVITDNDGDYTHNIEERYSAYQQTSLMIFSDMDNDRKTFEVGLYKDNESLCNTLFDPNGTRKDVLTHMLANKADCAYKILMAENNTFHVPSYIKDAIEWISQE